MAKPETLFYGRINKRLPHDVWKEKMHNMYRGGTPDFWYSGFKSDLWAEYKWIKELPVRATTPIKADLSGLQLLWLDDAMRKGHNICVIVGSPQGCAILTDGAWRNEFSHAAFQFSESDVAIWLMRKLCVPNSAISANSGSDKSSLQNCNNFIVNRWHGSRSP